MKRILFSSLLFVSALSVSAINLDWLNVLTSPVVGKDSVLFRISAPAASKVELKGQFIKYRIPLERNEKGLWQVSVAKPSPDIYPYSFVVDGVEVSDPGNVRLFPNESFKSSMLEIPDSTALYTVRDVPHGKIHYDLYKSGVLDEFRNLLVYTPAEYDKNPMKNYPVFYLISGTTDTEEVWYKVGNVNLILDNLIASGEAEPMIVVMPYGYMNNGTPQPSSLEAAEMYDVFARELTESVMPYIESNYRTVPDKYYRAIAGFSRGGGQSMFTALRHPDKFGWLNSYSAYLTPEVIDKYFPNVVSDCKDLKSLWFGVGKSDFLYNDVVENLNYFKSRNIEYDSFIPEGGHTWMHARKCLVHSLRTLFKDKEGENDYRGFLIDDLSMPGYTIYRPDNIDEFVAKNGKLKPFIFGNGACSHNSAVYIPLFSRLVKEGYIVMAVGSADESSIHNKPVNDLSEIGREDGLVDAIDWLTRQNENETGKLYNMVDTEAFAVGGHSCGGAQALAASYHPKVKTTLVLNAGMGDMSMAGADSETLKTLHSPVLYLIGGADDIAYGNAEKDYKRIGHVPVVCMNIPVGHGGTYKQPGGGVFGEMISGWLAWHLKGDAGKSELFVGNGEYDVKSKNLKKRGIVKKE